MVKLRVYGLLNLMSRVGGGVGDGSIIHERVVLRYLLMISRGTVLSALPTSRPLYLLSMGSTRKVN